ncbi:MAG TPA: tetratricopeptide repeat-containing sensor histidine kinase [Puia sp.]|nr:tetratricopeptide repeat-containing sensor histidine kinase [Puia sp.]
MPKTFSPFFAAAISLLALFSCNTRNNVLPKTGNNFSVDSLISQTQKFGPESAAQAIAFIDSALAGKNLTLEQKVAIYGHKSMVYSTFLNNNAKAELYADSALYLAGSDEAREKYPAQYELASYAKGDVLFKEGRYSEAYTYYYQARLLPETHLSACATSSYSYRIAMILYKQSRFKEAAGTFQESFSETADCPETFSKYLKSQELLNNIALCYYKSGNDDTALQYYNKALAFIAANRPTHEPNNRWHDIARGVIYGNMGQIYKDQGKYDLAEKLFNQSIAINLKKGNDIWDAQSEYVKLADLFYKENKIDSMGFALGKIRKSLDALPNFTWETEWQRLMWQYAEKRDRPSEAYTHLALYTRGKDSMEKINKAITTVDASNYIKVLEKQHDIDLLTKKNDLKDHYLMLAGSCSALLLIIGWLIWRNAEHSRNNVERLTKLNDTINSQKLQLEQALNLVEKRSEEKDRILHIVAHDLRSPIASIMTLSSVIKKADDKEETDKVLQFMHTACSTSLALIAEILGAAESQNYENDVQEIIDVDELVNDSVELLHVKASEKKQTFNLQLNGKAKFFTANREKINRVIGNLLTNAIKFSNDNKQITVITSATDQRVRIAVKDSGIGIPDKLKDKVFERFTKAKRKGTMGEPTFGLGLSICKEITEYYNGSIWFESKENEGTTFYLEFPGVDPR